MDKYGLGPKGEDYALELLRDRGHRLLERNFRCPHGEIDLVTWHKDTLVFVEVRTHAPQPGRSPADTVNRAKQQRIIRTAKWYVAKRWGNRPLPFIRFDVVWLHADGPKITGGGVLEGAFCTR